MKFKIIFALAFLAASTVARAQTTTEIKTDQQTIVITQEKSEAEKKKEAAEKTAPVAAEQKTTEIKTENQTIIISTEKSGAEKNAPVADGQKTIEIKTDKQTIIVTQGDSADAEPITTSDRPLVNYTDPAQIVELYKRPDAKERRKRYVKSIFSPVALGRSVVGAGIGTWRNSPAEWGKGWEGFGRRVASGLGKNVIKQTALFGLDEAFRLDSKFYRSNKRDFGSKLGNALISPFTARSASGKRVFGLPRIAATYASNIIAYETWYPNRFGFKDALKAGTISLGFNAAFNVLKEFVWKK